MIREYGARRLSPAHADAVRLRHRDHYRRLANRFAAEYFTSRQADWYVRLRREHGNIRAALESSLGEPGEASAVLDMPAPLGPWWHAGHLHVGVQYLTRAVHLAPEPTRSRGYGLLALSNLAVRLSEFDRSAGLAGRVRRTRLTVRPRTAGGPGPKSAQGRVARREPPLRGHDVAGRPARRERQPAGVEPAAEHGAAASKGWTLWGPHSQRYPPAGTTMRSGHCGQATGFSSPCRTSTASASASASRPCPGVRRSLGRTNVSRDCSVQRRRSGAPSVGMTHRRSGESSTADPKNGCAPRSVTDASKPRLRPGSGVLRGPGRCLGAGSGPRWRTPFPTATSHAAAAARGSLTRREWEIAQLPCRGLSNKDIATRLVISQRTAETTWRTSSSSWASTPGRR